MFPDVVISGFASAAAMIISSTQFTGLVGISKCHSDGGSCNFLLSVQHVILSVSDFKIPVLVCSTLCLVCLLSFKAKAFGSGIVSNFGPLTVVAVSILAVRIMESFWGSENSPLELVSFLFGVEFEFKGK